MVSKVYLSCIRNVLWATWARTFVGDHHCAGGCSMVASLPALMRQSRPTSRSLMSPGAQRMVDCGLLDQECHPGVAVSQSDN